MSNCPKCQSTNREGASICRICGTPLGAPKAGPRMCPAGRHPMDPSWTECPYCRTAAAAAPRNPTMMEGTSAPAAPAAPAGGPAPVPPPVVRPRRSGTQFMPEGVDAPTAAPAPARKIVAILATWSWKPEGQIFPVYEGRNLIGGAPECEIRMEADPQMSGRHATLVHRGGVFLLDDASSMNGTFLEGSDVLEKTRLANYANIRTGATHWRFVILDPEALA